MLDIRECIVCVLCVMHAHLCVHAHGQVQVSCDALCCVCFICCVFACMCVACMVARVCMLHVCCVCACRYVCSVCVVYVGGCMWGLVADILSYIAFHFIF